MILICACICICSTFPSCWFLCESMLSILVCIQMLLVPLDMAHLMFDKLENCQLLRTSSGSVCHTVALFCCCCQAAVQSVFDDNFINFHAIIIIRYQTRQIESLDFPFGEKTNTFYCWYFDIDTSTHIILSQAHRHATALHHYMLSIFRCVRDPICCDTRFHQW